MSDSNTQAAVTVATLSFRKLDKSDIGKTVLLQAMKRTYEDNVHTGESWTDAVNFTVLGLRPATVDGRFETTEANRVDTFYRADVRIVKDVKVKPVKEPKVIKVGLDLCHDKTDTNPFGKVSIELAVERMTEWTATNRKRGAHDLDFRAIFLAAGQKIAPAMKDLRAYAAAAYAGQTETREAEAMVAKQVKVDAAAAKAKAQLEALVAKVEAAKVAGEAKAIETEATKQKLVAEAQARLDAVNAAETTKAAKLTRAERKAARKAA